MTQVESRVEQAKGGDKSKRCWVFQGAVQGSIVFRQYYPEGGWGWVLVLAGLLMTLLTAGFQLSFGVLVRPAVWKFQPSLLSFLSLAGLSSSVSLGLAPLAVSLCKVRGVQLELTSHFLNKTPPSPWEAAKHQLYRCLPAYIPQPTHHNFSFS